MLCHSIRYDGYFLKFGKVDSKEFYSNYIIGKWCNSVVIKKHVPNKLDLEIKVNWGKGIFFKKHVTNKLDLEKKKKEKKKKKKDND